MLQLLGQLSWAAVVIAAILSLVIGFLWMSVFFKSPYRKYMYNIEDVQNHPSPSGGQMAFSFLTYIFVSLITAVAYAVSLNLFRAAGEGIGYDGNDWVNAAWFTLLCAAGYTFPFTVGKKVWQFKSWIVVAIDSSYELVRFALFLFIFWNWH